jgi:hypothetical protein
VSARAGRGRAVVPVSTRTLTPSLFLLTLSAPVPPYADENFKLKHKGPGLLSMANSGKVCSGPVASVLPSPPSLPLA